jgi:hypothetical protein
MAVINGTSGADALNGTGLGDQINGGAGADVIRGFGGADTLDGGAGDDRFTWNAGEGSDRVEGGADIDTQFLTGDSFVISANAGRALVNNLGETVDLHGVETLNLHGVAAASSFAVGDLSTTDVRQVVIGLGTQPGSDSVDLTGGATGDTITVQVLNGTGLRVFDTVGGVLQTTVISNVEAADRVVIDGGGGNDAITITTPSGLASAAPIEARGGLGADTVTGSIGRDVLAGDAGDDRIVSGGGADSIDGGLGADLQVITGGDGVDTVSLRAQGNVLRETVGGVTSDVVNVETLNIRTLGQGDTIDIGDLTATSVMTVNVDLSGARGGPDDGTDTVVLPSLYQDGMLFIPTLSLTSASDGSGVQAVYSVNDAVLETLKVTALGAGDVLKVGGDDGDDGVWFTLLAVDRTIQVDGGRGENFVGLDGGAGNDTMDVSGNAGHVAMTMNGLLLLDAVNVQYFAVNPGAGSDTIRVSEIGGTGVFTSVDADLGILGPGRVPDGQADTVVLNFAIGSGGTLTGTQFGHLMTQSFAVLDSDGHELGRAYIDDMDAQDRIVANLLGDGDFKLRGAFNQTDFRLGSADDTIEWTVDRIGHDSLDGGAGQDALDMRVFIPVRNIDHGSWNISLGSAGGTSKLSLHHVDSRNGDLFDLAVDLTRVENLSLHGASAQDFIVVADQSGTSVRHIDIDVGAESTGHASDFVVLDGSSSADTISVSQISGDVTVSGLPASASIHDLDTSDHVFIRSGGGNDWIDLSNHNPGRGVVHIDAGVGSDTLIGGFGSESFELHRDGGHDVVFGFDSHKFGGESDVITVFSNDHSLAQMEANGHIFRSGLNVVLTDGAGASLTLMNIKLGDLTDSDFLF